MIRFYVELELFKERSFQNLNQSQASGTDCSWDTKAMNSAAASPEIVTKKEQ
jgi:hypothetical protein